MEIGHVELLSVTMEIATKVIVQYLQIVVPYVMHRLEAGTCTDPQGVLLALHLEEVPRLAILNRCLGEVPELWP